MKRPRQERCLNIVSTQYGKHKRVNNNGQDRVRPLDAARKTRFESARRRPFRTSMNRTFIPGAIRCFPREKESPKPAKYNG